MKKKHEKAKEEREDNPIERGRKGERQKGEREKKES